MTENIQIPENQLKAIYEGYSLVNQGVSPETLTDWYCKAYRYNGAITFVALIAAVIKIQGAVNQNSDLLLSLKESIESGSGTDAALAAAVADTRSIDLKDFINSLFAVVGV